MLLEIGLGFVIIILSLLLISGVVLLYDRFAEFLDILLFGLFCLGCIFIGLVVCWILGSFTIDFWGLR